MPAALAPVKKYVCTFKGCVASFDNPKDLRKHKRSAEDHEYCSKCDEDFENWDDLVAHKASSDEHISCKFCGEDFKTKSGRDRHIKQMHPVDQHLPCVGCGMIFVRAAALVHHLENGLCKKIQKDDFVGYVQHKNVITRLLQNPELINSTMAKDWRDAGKDNSTGGGVSLQGPLIQDEPEETPRQMQERLGRAGAGPWDADIPTVNSIQGLMDARDENEQGLPGHQVMLPLKAAYSKSPQMDSENQFPSLGARNTALRKEENDTMKALRANLIDLSVSSNPPARDKGKDKEKATATTPRSPQHPPSPNEPDTIIVVSTPATKAPKAWGNGATTVSTLFSDAKPTPVTADWDAAVKAHDEHSELDKRRNMFHNRFWDPADEDWEAERFFNPIIERYLCPFPQCENIFTEPLYLENHIRYEHKSSQVRCPSCLKLFKTTTALISHCEAPNARCRLSKSSRFGQAIDTFSGGFLGARTALRPDMTDDDNAHTTYTKYEATKPPGWKDMKIEGVTVTTVGERGMGTATRRVIKGETPKKKWLGSRQKWANGELEE